LLHPLTSEGPRCCCRVLGELPHLATLEICEAATPTEAPAIRHPGRLLPKLATLVPPGSLTVKIGIKDWSQGSLHALARGTDLPHPADIHFYFGRGMDLAEYLAVKG
jgi:hypothetical protein